MKYHFGEPVYYRSSEAEDNAEKLGRWAGPDFHCGDVLTYQIITADTEQIIRRSDIRTATDPANPNLCAELAALNNLSSEDGECDDLAPRRLFTEGELADGQNNPSEYRAYRWSPDEVIGRSYLQNMPDGSVVRATVVRRLESMDHDNTKNVRFLVSFGGGGKYAADQPDDVLKDKAEDVIAYTELCDIMEEQYDKEQSGGEDVVHAFDDIIAHQGPLNQSDPRYKGSKYNVTMRWADGTQTDEPLKIVAKDDPITTANYAFRHGLLEQPGWKHLRKYIRNGKRFRRMVKQAQRNSKANAPKFKYGIEVPRNERHAVELDQANGNSLWQEGME